MIKFHYITSINSILEKNENKESNGHKEFMKTYSQGRRRLFVGL